MIWLPHYRRSAKKPSYPEGLPIKSGRRQPREDFLLLEERALWALIQELPEYPTVVEFHRVWIEAVDAMERMTLRDIEHIAPELEKHWPLGQREYTRAAFEHLKIVLERHADLQNPRRKIAEWARGRTAKELTPLERLSEHRTRQHPVAPSMLITVLDFRSREPEYVNPRYA